MTQLGEFYRKATRAPRTRQPRNVEFVGSDIMPGSEEYLQLDGREEQAQRLALALPSSFGAASNVAKMAAQHDPHVGKQSGPDDRPEPQKNHPFERVMWRPSKWMSSTFVWWFTYTALPIRGEAFLFVEDGGLPTGDVLELWPIPPWRVKPVPSKNTKNFISHYNYWPESGSKAIPMPASNICWIRQPNVLDLHTGMSTVSPAQSVVGLAKKQWDWRNAFYGKFRGLPATAVGIKKDVSTTQMQKLKREWFQEFAALRRGTVLHRMGDIDVQRLGDSADDMQLLPFQEHDAKIIQQLFGWNPSLGEASSYAHADVSKEVVAEVGAWPLMKLLAGDLSAQVLWPRYGEDFIIHYNKSDVVPKRADAERADYQVYGQEKTTNQLRIERGDKPITKGPFAEAYEYITTRTLPAYFQMQAGAQAKPEPEAQTPPVPVVSEDVKADLAKWDRKAQRTASESACGAAAFESEHISADLHARIAGALTFTRTAEDVKGVFACILQPSMRS